MGAYKDEKGTTRVGDFLRGVKGIAPDVLEFAGNVTGVKQLNALAGMIKTDTKLSAADKETALKLLEFDIIEAQEITKRWQSDMQSDSWLSKNVRPLSLVVLTAFMMFIIFADSKDTWKFDVKESYITLMETLLVVVYFAYFGSRGYEKAQKIKNK